MKLKHARIFALIFGLSAFSLGIYFAIDGDIRLSVVNFGGSLFATYLYVNPALLIAKSGEEIDVLLETAKDPHILWISIGIGVLGILLAL